MIKIRMTEAQMGRETHKDRLFKGFVNRLNENDLGWSRWYGLFETGLKINSKTYCQFLRGAFFKQWKKSGVFHWGKIYMPHHMHPSTPSLF